MTSSNSTSLQYVASYYSFRHIIIKEECAISYVLKIIILIMSKSEGYLLMKSAKPPNQSVNYQINDLWVAETVFWALTF